MTTTAQTITDSAVIGDYDGSAVFSMSNTYNLTDAHVVLGSQNTGFLQVLTGKIGEVILYNTGLSQAEYQYIEGYLACKWGLQGRLPTGHPYQATCPSGTKSFAVAIGVSPTGAQVPGVDLTYSSKYTNNGGIIDYNPVVVAPVPAHTSFKVGSVTSSLGTTGLSVAVTYSNNGGSTYAYTPVSGAGGAPSGYDATVTNVQWSFTGALGCGSVNNTGSTSFIARVQ